MTDMFDLIEALNARDAAAAAQAAPAPKPAVHAPPADQSDPFYARRAAAWAPAALAGVAHTLAAMPPDSGRNAYLSAQTWRFLRYAHAGHIPPGDVLDTMRDAAHTSGLSYDEIDSTLRSAITGADKDGPSNPELRDTPPPTSSSSSAPAAPAGDGAAPAEPTPGPTLHEQMVSREVAILRARKEAQKKITAEEAALAFREPPSRHTLTLELQQTDAPVLYAIEQLLPEGGNALLTAQYKTGKTTTINDLIRAYADKQPFLGKYATHPHNGRIAVFNYELSEQQYRAWLRELGIINTDNVSILNLRGYRLPLTAPNVENWIVSWLKDHDTRVWVLDPLARAATGTDEDSNTEMGVWLDTLDVIKDRAGVGEAILPNHTGRMTQEEGAERGRGATRVDDWADVRWILTRDQDGNRYFRATGRDVEVEEQKLTYDPITRQLTIGGGDRAWVKKRTLQEAVLAYVTLNPGCTASDIENGVQGGNKEIGTARKTLVGSRELTEDKAVRGYRYSIGRRSSP